MSVIPPDEKPCRRAEIVAAAMRIADAEGVEAVSMRRLADELGVATMTPYTHVESKDELIDLMRDAVAAEMILPEPIPADWREALRAIAHRTKDAFEAHPWSLDVASRRPRARINRLRHVEQSVAIMVRLEVAPQTGRAILMSIDDYVIGYCARKRMRQRMLASLGAEGKAALHHFHDPDPEVAAALDAGELPLIKKITGDRNREHPFGVPPDSGFEPGLEWLLDGIEGAVDPAREALDPGALLTGHDELDQRLARAGAEVRSS
ncbi:MAG TPA: TetR/AcrR family transcriptional regulator C-terminal domain-containing protein [Solirubrobacterales bacterium]|jgi:AcrR family transcriptional regulator|nr:TetR/AcrR family transcriptional regulator C-terminal domain-containing protein [Solirubrobacterales bacterium]